MKTTKVSALAGRVIESVSIFSGTGEEEPLSLEIRCVGGVYFSIELAAKVSMRGHVLLAEDREGTLRNKRSRDFMVTHEAPGNVPEEGEEDDD